MGKVLMVVTACTAVGLLIYLGIHRDEYSGGRLESLPGNEPSMIHLRRSAEPDPAADAKFGER